MTAGWVLIVPAIWVVVGLPLPLIAGHFIDFGAETEPAGDGGAYEEAACEAA